MTCNKFGYHIKKTAYSLSTDEEIILQPTIHKIFLGERTKNKSLVTG